mmetsp:Transcript_81031/g.156489  ORF Transcript_81031/g.156489 Transcript_81031/m.156489 type:complete len:320 (+) Transcript_81031:111-1070(+)
MEELPPWNDAWGPPVQKMIARSPPAHAADVVNQCRRLVGEVPMPQDLVNRAMSENNEKSLLVVPLNTGNGLQGIVCDFARHGGSRAHDQVPYLDPRLDMVFMVNQECQECVRVTEKPKSKDIKAEMEGIDLQKAKPFRQAAQRELDRYIAAHFPMADGNAAGCVLTSHGKDIDGDVELRIFISSHRARHQGHWAGYWTSQWRIIFVPGQQDPVKFGGIIEFKTHYGEDGNVHFRRKVTKMSKVSELKNTQEFAVQLVTEIGRLETEFHEATDDFCDTFGPEALKAIRRVLPISKERFDWRPIRHALVRDMKAAGKEGHC